MREDEVGRAAVATQGFSDPPATQTVTVVLAGSPGAVAPSPDGQTAYVIDSLAGTLDHRPP